LHERNIPRRVVEEERNFASEKRKKERKKMEGEREKIRARGA